MCVTIGELSCAEAATLTQSTQSSLSFRSASTCSSGLPIWSAGADLRLLPDPVSGLDHLARNADAMSGLRDPESGPALAHSNVRYRDERNGSLY